MQIVCESCGAVVPAENLNLERMVAKCGACDAVFAFHVDEAPRRRENIAQPEKIQVDRRGDETVVRRSWRNVLGGAFLLVFAVMWNGIVWSGTVFSDALDFSCFNWFLLPFQVIGLFVAYLALAMFVNTTTLTVSRARLLIRHGPLPFPGGIDMDPDEIEQVFVDEQLDMHRHTREQVHTVSDRVSRSYRLQARLKDGTKKTLIRTLPDADEALWLEQLLEDELGIVDRPVRGEYR